MNRTEREFMTGWEFALTNSGKTQKEELDWECPGDEAFSAVRLPHDWAVSMPVREDMERGTDQGFLDRWGIGWYRKRFELSAVVENRRYLLDFGGIFEDSTIWVNGIRVGGRQYGYSPFRLDVTEALKNGENELLVRVNNTNDPADRWYSGCGIYRTVKWIETDGCHLDENEVVVRTEPEGSRARVRVLAGRKGRVRISLRDEEAGCEAARVEGDGDTFLEMEVPDAKLWSAETPFLYDLVLELLKRGEVCDTVRLKIGIRRVEFLPGKGMFVNGVETKLKGVCVHQEAGCRGIAAKKEVWRARLNNLKEAGCNAVRAAHHMHSAEFMDLCDELGFYVYEECFDKWTGGLYGRYFETQWKADMEAMIKRDRNRPSVLFWGVGNEVENQGQESMLLLLRMLTDYARSLDASRPVTYAMNPHFKRESPVDMKNVQDIQRFVDEVSDTEIYDAKERVERIKKIGEIVDIVSCNYQEQWYPLIHEALPDKLILGTEVYQYFSGHRDQMQNFSEENPSLVPYRYPWCIGSLIWAGIDFLGESMGYPSKGWCGSLLRTNGERRPNYYVMQSYWKKEPMVHFSVMDYSMENEMVKEHWDAPMYADHWDFPQYRRAVIPYMIATNCDEAALYLNGKRFFVKRPADFENRVITGFLPWQPGTVKVVGYVNGREAASCETVTPGEAVKLTFDPLQKEGAGQEGEKEDAKIVCPAREGYEILLTVRAADEDGNFCIRKEADVKFEAEGEGEIIAVDNGNMRSDIPYLSDHTRLYYGCASVMVRLNGERGRVKVTASADGMKKGEIVLQVI